MKKQYTITISGYGAEVCCHKLNESQRQKLEEMSGDGSVEGDEESIQEILGNHVVNIFAEGDEVIAGALRGEEVVTLWECAVDDYRSANHPNREITDVEADFSSEVAYDCDYLFAVNKVKGTYGVFELSLDSEIDLSKLVLHGVDLNGQIYLVDGILYDGQELNRVDGLDTDSKGVEFILSSR